MVVLALLDSLLERLVVTLCLARLPQQAVAAAVVQIQVTPTRLLVTAALAVAVLSTIPLLAAVEILLLFSHHKVVTVAQDQAHKGPAEAAGLPLLERQGLLLQQEATVVQEQRLLFLVRLSLTLAVVVAARH